MRTNSSLRTELFQKAGEQIAKIKGIQSFDLQKGQFEHPDQGMPKALPACLMAFRTIHYEDMSNQIQEGRAVVSFYLYMGDGGKGAAEQAANAEAYEVFDLVDQLVEAIQWLEGDLFGPLSQKLEKSASRKYGMPSYRLDFETQFCRQLKPRFVSQKNGGLKRR